MSRRKLTLFGVVLLYGICGAASCPLFDWHPLLLPIPFGVISALLFLRSARAILVVPLYILVWFAAFSVAMEMGMFWTPQSDYLPMCIAGSIGGLGVCLASGIVNRCLLSPRYLLGAGLVGCVAALPFVLWLDQKNAAERMSMNATGDAWQPLRFLCSFAVWQAGVGTYLYAVCTECRRKRDAVAVAFQGQATKPPEIPFTTRNRGAHAR